jgi:hypothetical protein
VLQKCGSTLANLRCLDADRGPLEALQSQLDQLPLSCRRRQQLDPAQHRSKTPLVPMSLSPGKGIQIKKLTRFLQSFFCRSRFLSVQGLGD